VDRTTRRPSRGALAVRRDPGGAVTNGSINVQPVAVKWDGWRQHLLGREL